MREAPILVVGGGPAGASAAATLAEAGMPVLLIEQRDMLGGAIHRQPAPGVAKLPQPIRHRRNWAALSARLQAASDRVELRTQTVFIGVDDQGRFLFDDRSCGRVFSRRIRGAIIAVGAVETIRPFPGWDLPGVMSAGAAQVLLKETGQPLEGPVLVAGSGPLLLAVSAQFARAGNPPVAVLERGRPWRAPGALARLALSGPQLGEAASYATTLALNRVAYHTGSEVVGAATDGDGLLLQLRIRGQRRTQRVRHLLVHDGLTPNHTGIPPADPDAAVPILLAGDGREILGADAALDDGERAARQMLSRLGHPGIEGAAQTDALTQARRFQTALAAAFHSAISAPTPETVICRCEGRSYAELAALPEDASAREIRLMGRFGLGACQGRICGPMIAALRGRPLPAATTPRWPLRPVSLASLAKLTIDETE